MKVFPYKQPSTAQGSIKEGVSADSKVLAAVIEKYPVDVIPDMHKITLMASVFHSPKRR